MKLKLIKLFSGMRFGIRGKIMSKYRLSKLFLVVVLLAPFIPSLGIACERGKSDLKECLVPVPSREDRVKYYIRSEPAGATVFLNGEKLLKTPLTVKDGAADGHSSESLKTTLEMRLELDGYQSFSWQIKKGKTGTFEVKLEPLGSLDHSHLK